MRPHSCFNVMQTRILKPQDNPLLLTELMEGTAPPGLSEKVHHSLRFLYSQFSLEKLKALRSAIELRLWLNTLLKVLTMALYPFSDSLK